MAGVGRGRDEQLLAAARETVALAATISAIVPTAGRPESLRGLLRSLAAQGCRDLEVIVADAGSDGKGAVVARDAEWAAAGIHVVHEPVAVPNAVGQRNAAIARSIGQYLLFLDDDVVLEPGCVECMRARLERERDVVAVMATFTNQPWPPPTRLWAWYIDRVLGVPRDEWQGRVLGPLLRFGYFPLPGEASPVQWVGTGNSMVRRAAFAAAGGFSDFFLHRCTTNEDVDLGVRLSRQGRMLLLPECRMAHHRAPAGRVSARMAAEDDAHNRFMVLTRTIGHTRARATRLMLLYGLFEGASDLAAIARGRSVGTSAARIWGRAAGIARALARRP